MICIHSSYKFEGKLPLGIQIANKIRESSKRIADTLEFESELTLRSPEEVTEMGLATLTGLDTPPVGALEQSIFYVNQVMQFGKLLAVFQRHPTDPKQTVVTVFMALGVESNLLSKKKEYSKVPVLRNLVPAQVLAGKSSFNTGNSISAGLPVYARNQIKAIAAILREEAAAVIALAGAPTGRDRRPSKTLDFSALCALTSPSPADTYRQLFGRR